MYAQVKKFKILGFPSSNIEVRDLLKAWSAISIAFAILLTGGKIMSIGFFLSLFISAFTVGTGFLLHELGHKIVAQKYGYFAEFRSFDQMLVIAILLSFFGFIFAAPGAVMIKGMKNLKHNGHISAAGPAVNIFLSLLFLIGLMIFPNMVFQYGFYINAILAGFNLIPIGMFDGKKIFVWNKLVWGLMLLLTAGLFVVQGLIM